MEFSIRVVIHAADGAKTEILATPVEAVSAFQALRAVVQRYGLADEEVIRVEISRLG